jgi:hypothetical protein
MAVGSRCRDEEGAGVFLSVGLAVKDAAVEINATGVAMRALISSAET